MKIKRITWRNRRDFSAIMICEHCEKEEELKSGYDDDDYHNEVIPKMKCKHCGKTAGESYIPQKTKYEANEVI